MSEYYELFPEPSGFGPSRWVADESISLSDRVIKKGFWTGANVVKNVDEAAQIFGDLLAEKEYGETYTAYSVSVYLRISNGIIYEMQPSEPAPGGGTFVMEPMHFAVMVKSETN